MTSLNGNISRVTGHLCGEFTGPRWIPRTKASDAELSCFFYLRPNERLSKQWWDWWFETLSSPLWRHCNGTLVSSLYPRIVNRVQRIQLVSTVWLRYFCPRTFFSNDELGNLPWTSLTVNKKSMYVIRLNKWWDNLSQIHIKLSKIPVIYTAHKKFMNGFACRGFGPKNRSKIRRASNIWMDDTTTIL